MELKQRLESKVFNFHGSLESVMLWFEWGHAEETDLGGHVMSSVLNK